MKQRCLIFLNGEAPEFERLGAFLKETDFIVGVDGGARFVRKLGLVPDLLTGDFDSIDKESRELFRSERTEIVKWPVDKDESDFELCLNRLISEGFSEFIIAGAFGGRPDHMLFNLDCAVNLLSGAEVTFYDGSIMARLIRSEQEACLESLYGRELSLVPCTQNVTGVTVQGVKWPLKGVELTKGSSLSLSNRIEGRATTVSVGLGVLLTVQSKV